MDNAKESVSFWSSELTIKELSKIVEASTDPPQFQAWWVLALREESGHEVPSLTISVFSISEILNETYALPMVNRARATCIWRFYSTCLYWVSGSTLMRMTDMVSSSRGQSLCLQNVEWVRFWKVLLITWHGPFRLDHSCMDL